MVFGADWHMQSASISHGIIFVVPVIWYVPFDTISDMFKTLTFHWVVHKDPYGYNPFIIEKYNAQK